MIKQTDCRVRGAFNLLQPGEALRRIGFTLEHREAQQDCVHRIAQGVAELRFLRSCFQPDLRFFMVQRSGLSPMPSVIATASPAGRFQSCGLVFMYGSTAAARRLKSIAPFTQ